MTAKNAEKSNFLPAINKRTPGNKVKHYTVLLDKLSGGMKFNYLMVDEESQSLNPVMGRVCWGWLNNWIHFRGCVLKNCLYLTGGKDRSTGKFTRKVMKYNPSTCKWTECASVTTERIGHTTTVFSGKIWVIGKDCIHAVKIYF